MLPRQAIVEITHIGLVPGKTDEGERCIRLHLGILRLQVVGTNHLFLQLQGIVVDADAVFVQIHCPDFMPVSVVKDSTDYHLLLETLRHTPGYVEKGNII